MTIAPPDANRAATVAPAAAWRTTWSDARRSQALFDVLLRTLSRPGTVATTPGDLLPDGAPTALLLPLALGDPSQSVAVITGDADGRWTRSVCDATGARPSVLEAAHVAVALTEPTPGQILALRRGRPDAPEAAARLAIRCDALVPLPSSGPVPPRPRPPAATMVEVAGPGVPGRRRVEVDGLSPDVLAAIAEANRAFPCGIDVWLTADDGTVAALARSSNLRVTALHSEER
ncbi:MAG: phosphonate C-P lyase system protein PhnH [Acidimicrobiia bacterium]|nr:phosphonate C-P lyase system protein PhnH [Acidimicrobiia bacterium]